MNPRTSDSQTIPTRPARGKYGVQSRRSAFSIRGKDTIPGYVVSMYPGMDTATYRVMADIVRRFESENEFMPSPNQCRMLFDGLID